MKSLKTLLACSFLILLSTTAMSMGYPKRMLSQRKASTNLNKGLAPQKMGIQKPTDVELMKKATQFGAKVIMYKLHKR